MSNRETHYMYFNEEEMFQLFTSLFDIVFIMKYEPPEDFRYIKVSENAKKFAMLQDADIGNTINDIYHQSLAKHLTYYYHKAISSKEKITFRDRMNINSEDRYGETILIPFTFESVSYVVGLTRDITRVVNLEQNQANDPITGLPFVENFIENLEANLHLKKFEESVWYLLYIAVNHLSIVPYSNQNIEAELLKEITGRLERFLKNEDRLSRASGNEFIIAFRLTSDKECEKIVNQIYEAIECPYETEDFEVIVQPSIGVARMHPDHYNVQGSITEAFQGMLQAKSKEDRHIYITFAQNHFESDIRQNTLEQDLSYAQKKNELEVYYQPKLNIQKNVYNFEALLRWNHPKFGMILPNEFIPIAERNQSITSIGRWVLKQVCKDFQAFQEINKNISIAVNISPVQLNDPRFVQQIKEAVLEYSIEPKAIELEITENDLLNLDSAQKQFEELSYEGFSIVLDDFGTSYSSLNYLKELSVQKIKIDKSFIMNMDYYQKDYQIVQMIIKLAKNLDLEVTAEGVEKWKHIEMLSKMDCTEIQGYYLSKPLPLQDMLEKLKDNTMNI
ncbi:diguanylate cyclase (GGDEF) domain-containing protein [Salinibacillus kushneri]|uniref:Diguanylate cyclase (GGDEF) domain-containing protein n=1 Tax=Salinibacillus kushneri TaxID=237682 RepID=A0A1I0CQ95_9BACI|nr:GGDEF domain-containing phosphodiesterase [Salinibacillus kushneri]SET21396.1 diguanylate cyclase (GGDEF) domain-containing protein [Salinibacillus kushneri]